MLISHFGDVETETRVKQFSLYHTFNRYWDTQSPPIKTGALLNIFLAYIKKGYHLFLVLIKF